MRSRKPNSVKIDGLRIDTGDLRLLWNHKVFPFQKLEFQYNILQTNEIFLFLLMFLILRINKKA